MPDPSSLNLSSFPAAAMEHGMCLCAAVVIPDAFRMDHKYSRGQLFTIIHKKAMLKELYVDCKGQALKSQEMPE